MSGRQSFIHGQQAVVGDDAARKAYDKYRKIH